MKPQFLSELPTGTFHLRVLEDPGGANDHLNIDLTIAASTYTIPFAYETGGSPSYSGIVNLWEQLVDALTAKSAADGSGYTYSISVVASDEFGTKVTIRNDDAGGSAIEIDYTNTTSGQWVSDGDPAWAAGESALDLELLGFTSGDYDPTPLAYPVSEFQPKYTWIPGEHFDSGGHVPEPAMISSSGLTADGSEHTVTQDDGTIRYWRSFEVAQGGSGVHRARVDAISAQESQPEDWGASLNWATAAANRKTWVALNGTDGWWHRTRSAAWKFIVIEDIDDIPDSIKLVAGSTVEYRISYARTAPVGMDDWRGLRGITRAAHAGGRVRVSFAALKV